MPEELSREEIAKSKSRSATGIVPIDDFEMEVEVNEEIDRSEQLREKAKNILATYNMRLLKVGY